MRHCVMGDFGQKPTPAIATYRTKPAIPQRTSSFFQNVTDRVRYDLSMADKKFNQIFFPKGDYIKPIGKGGMSHVVRPVAVPQVIKPAIKETPKPSSQLVVSSGTKPSSQLVVSNGTKPSSPAKTPMSPVAIAGVAAAVVGLGFFFLKD